MAMPASISNWRSDSLVTGVGISLSSGSQLHSIQRGVARGGGEGAGGWPAMGQGSVGLSSAVMKGRWRSYLRSVNMGLVGGNRKFSNVKLRSGSFLFRGRAVEQQREVEVEEQEDEAVKSCDEENEDNVESEKLVEELSSPRARRLNISGDELHKQTRRGSSAACSGMQKQDKAGGRASPRKLLNLAEEWASFTGPREKGDVRDVVLMSLSFAVYIYISQHLVHAYCAFKNLYHKPF